MTLTEALLALCEAGRIRSPWLPGMLAHCPRRTPPESMRVLAVDPALLLPAAWATFDEGAWDVYTLSGDGWPDGAEPDVADPATVGCLAALCREACPGRQVWCEADDTRDPGGWWTVVANEPGSFAQDYLTTDHRTEGEAWAAALIALAGRSA